MKDITIEDFVKKYNLVAHDIICDDSNNSEKDKQEGKMNVDIYLEGVKRKKY